MKKLFALFAVTLAALSASAKETTTTLHEAEWTCTDSWSGHVQIDNTAARTYAAGDKIVVTVTAKGGVAEWPQVKIQYSDADWQWQNFDEGDNYTAGLWSVEEYPYTAEFTLTESMAEKVNAGKALILTGCDYTGSKVEWIHYEADPEPGTETTLWEGEKTMGNDWGPDDFIMFEAGKFANVEAGSTLIVHVTALGEGSNGNAVILQNGSWANFSPELVAYPGEPMDVEFTLTQNILDEIASTNGLVVKGVNYTVTKISVKAPGTSGISQLKAQGSQLNAKVIENGRVVILSADKKYSTNGTEMK